MDDALLEKKNPEEIPDAVDVDVAAVAVTRRSFDDNSRRVIIITE